MYSKFINDFNASIEALTKEKIAFREVAYRYAANVRTWYNRAFEAWRDRVFTDVELETFTRYINSKTARTAKTHLEQAIKNERHE